MLEKFRNKREPEKYHYPQNQRKPLSQLLLEYEEYDELSPYKPRKKRLNLAETDYPNEYKEYRPRQQKRDMRKNPLRKDKLAFDQ